MDLFYGRGDLDGDDVGCRDQTAECSSDQNPGEQDGCEEEMAGVFCGCERTTGGAGLASARVKRDVLDVLVS